MVGRPQGDENQDGCVLWRRGIWELPWVYQRRRWTPSSRAGGDEWSLESATSAQPVIFDADGSLRPSLLGFAPSTSGGSAALQVWQNDGKGMGT
jgi:hypothetical protein